MSKCTTTNFEPLGHLAMDRANVAVEERVFDVGCGVGHTAQELGEKVGANSSVVGVDIAAPMIECEQQRARDSGAENLPFQLADAQTPAFSAAEFDLVYSRFGVMFFDEPEAAFQNLFGALRSAGRLAFVCLRAGLKQDNPVA